MRRHSVDIIRKHDFKGRLHCDDGPALKTPFRQEWHRHGVRHRKDGPAIITALTTGELVEYYVAGRRHRLDGPAYVSDDVHGWYVEGKLHRLDGPALVDLEKDQRGWFVRGIRHMNNTSYQKAAGLSDEQMVMLVLKYGDVEPCNILPLLR